MTVTNNAIALDGGAGTDFPATATTTVMICKQVSVNVTIDGDEAELVALSLEYTDAAAASLSNLDFLSVAPASVETVDLVGNVPQVWTGTSVQTKFTGDPIVSLIVTHNNTALAGTLKIIVMQDSTP